MDIPFNAIIFAVRLGQYRRISIAYITRNSEILCITADVCFTILDSVQHHSSVSAIFGLCRFGTVPFSLQPIPDSIVCWLYVLFLASDYRVEKINYAKNIRV